MLKRILILLFILLTVSIGFNLYLISFENKKENSFIKLQEKYNYLSKRILIENFNDILINFLDLRKSLREVIDPYSDSFAVYFEYLPTGISIGINEKSEFYSASLFKLPVVMSYYRHKERNGLRGDTKVILNEQMIDSRFGDLYKKGVGYELTTDEAAKLALVDSDNTAARALGPYIEEKDFDDVYKAVDLDLNLTEKGVVLTAKHYSSILKALFFSAVLTKEDSQKILKLLTESKFDDKLRAGIPAGVPVAHKIGVYKRDDGEFYSDCGIIYVPQRQYILCMISKTDENTARERMKKVSKIVYDYVSSKKK